MREEAERCSATYLGQLGGEVEARVLSSAQRFDNALGNCSPDSQT